MTEFLTHKSEIFIKKEKAIEFLLENRIISEIRPCFHCQSRSELKRTTIREKNIYLYKCTHSNCRRKNYLLAYSMFKGTKIEIEDLMFLLYGFL